MRRMLWLGGLILALVMPVHAQESALQALLDRYRDAESPSVVVLVQTADATYSVASGKIEVGKPEPTRVDSPFRLASVSKLYVAVAVLQWVEQGVIDLDEPISRYLPAEVANRIANTTTARVRDVLTMTSGIPEYLDDAFYGAVYDDPQHPWTALEALESFAYDLPASFESGTDYEYSNTTFVLLQVMLEHLTEKPLAEILQSQIFDPIGATHTFVQSPQDPPDAFVHAYEDWDEDGDDDDVTLINDGFGLGDGALVSTASDLARFYRALFVDQTLLDDAMLSELLTDPLGNEYGMAVEIVEDETLGLTYGHSGSVLGFTTDVRYYVEYDTIVVLLFADVNLDDQLGLDALQIVLENR